MVLRNTLWLRLGPKKAEKPKEAFPWQTAHPRSRVEELRALVASGEIDTVVLAFPDMQGRLQGKRFAAGFFLDEVLRHGTEGCNYLLAVDTEMNTVDGYAMSSWERGYGDFAMHPDLATLRRVPWNAGHRPAPRRPRLERRLARWSPRPARSCAASSTASPSAASPPRSAPSWSSSSSRTPTSRPGTRATAG